MVKRGLCIHCTRPLDTTKLPSALFITGFHALGKRFVMPSPTERAEQARLLLGHL